MLFILSLTPYPSRLEEAQSTGRLHALTFEDEDDYDTLVPSWILAPDSSSLPVFFR